MSELKVTSIEITDNKITIIRMPENKENKFIITG